MIELFRRVELITKNGYLFPALFVRLEGIVDAMTILVETSGAIEPLVKQHEELMALTEQYSNVIAQLTTDDRVNHCEEIRRLSDRVTANRLQLVQAMVNAGVFPATQKQGNTPVNENEIEIDGNTNWGEVSSNDFMRYLNTDETMESEPTLPPASEPVQVERDSTTKVIQTPAPTVQSGENGNGASNPTRDLPNSDLLDDVESIDSDQSDEKMCEDAPKPSENQTLIKVEGVSSDKPKASEIVVQNQPPANMTQAEIENYQMNMMVTNVIRNSAEFTYHQLLNFNVMFDEIVRMGEMPNKAMPFHFRQMNDFISKFVRDCIQRGLNVAFFEPMLIQNLAASFNEETRSNWKSQLPGGKVSLRFMKAFSYDQEERARDNWYTEGRLILASAARAAQQMVQTPNRDNPHGAAQTKGKAQSDEQPQCSYWKDPNVSNVNQRLNPGSHPGSDKGKPRESTGNQSSATHRDNSRGRSRSRQNHSNGAPNRPRDSSDKKQAQSGRHSFV